MKSGGTDTDRTQAFVRHRSRAERYAQGKSLREACPRSSHAAWKAHAGRPDPVRLVLQADKGRMPELLPLRHGRMVRSPFTFYRGSALAMAVDLAATPATGIRVQCCGDAHLCNFGGFATPERQVIFSINDLDETSRRAGSGTSGGSRRASWSPAATTASANPPRGTWSALVSGPTVSTWPSSAR